MRTIEEQLRSVRESPEQIKSTREAKKKVRTKVLESYNVKMIEKLTQAEENRKLKDPIKPTRRHRNLEPVHNNPANPQRNVRFSADLGQF